MPKKTRRGRGAPSEPWLTSPLPSDSSPQECVVDVDDGVCEISHTQHISSLTHQETLADLIRRRFGVVGAKSLINAYGPEVVADVARDLTISMRGRAWSNVRNPGGLFASMVKKLTPKEQRGNLHIVPDSDGADAIGGAS